MLYIKEFHNYGDRGAVAVMKKRFLIPDKKLAIFIIDRFGYNKAHENAEYYLLKVKERYA